jgi:RNA recognition motif-containing protein
LQYGKITDVEIKNTGKATTHAFAFVEFEQPKEAEEAVKELDGKWQFRQCLRVHALDIHQGKNTRTTSCEWSFPNQRDLTRV